MNQLLRSEVPPEVRPITVYKIVAVDDEQRRTSATMLVCQAVYRPGAFTYPPIHKSPLFAYRTLEAAQQEANRLKEINDGTGGTVVRSLEVWRATTTGEVSGPKRLPSIGVYYVGLLKRCGYGSSLKDMYTYFWKETAHCLRYHITRACGFVPSPSTVFCADLMIIERVSCHPFSDEETEKIPS